MDIELNEYEQLFLKYYRDTLDEMEAVSIVFPEIKKPKELSEKLKELKYRYLVRREMERIKDELFDEKELNPKRVKRIINEMIVDDTDKAPRSKMVYLAAEVTGLKKDQLFVHLNEKTDEELSNLISEKLKLKKADGSTDLS